MSFAYSLLASLVVLYLQGLEAEHKAASDALRQLRDHDHRTGVQVSAAPGLSLCPRTSPPPPFPSPLPPPHPSQNACCRTLPPSSSLLLNRLSCSFFPLLLQE